MFSAKIGRHEHHHYRVDKDKGLAIGFALLFFLFKDAGVEYGLEVEGTGCLD
jgi:hypothetical protein